MIGEVTEPEGACEDAVIRLFHVMKHTLEALHRLGLKRLLEIKDHQAHPAATGGVHALHDIRAGL